MKQVLFVNPPTPDRRKYTRNVDSASESKGNYLLQPFDFLLLSGSFPREHFEIEFIDAVANRWDLEKVFSLLKDKKPDIVVTAVIDALWATDRQFLDSLRILFPEACILSFGDALLEDKNAFDALRAADGIIASPLTFKPGNLINWTRDEVQKSSDLLGLRKIGEEPKVVKASTVAHIEQPRHELFLHDSYRWPFASYKRYSTVITSWGCPFTCSYCTASQLPSLYRSSEDVLIELESLQKLGVREIYFGDKSFGLPLQNTLSILQGMIEKKFSFSWSSYFHPNQYTPDLLELMKKSGCHTLIIGIETEDLASLKKYRRHVSRERIEGLIKHANKLKINICGDFLFGLLDEGEKEILKSIDYATRLKIDYASFNIASPLPNSSIKQAAVADGRMKADDHHFDTVGSARILSARHVSGDRLRDLRNRAVRRFYLRPGYLVKRLSRLRGFEHFMIQFEEMFELLKKSS